MNGLNNFDETIRKYSLEGKEEYLYSVIYTMHSLKSGQTWISLFYLQITPSLWPFFRMHSPDGVTLTEVAYIQLQLTTHLSTPKGWKAELAWLVDL